MILWLYACQNGALKRLIMLSRLQTSEVKCIDVVKSRSGTGDDIIRSLVKDENTEIETATEGVKKIRGN